MEIQKISNNIFKLESFITNKLTSKFTKSINEIFLQSININLKLLPLQYLFVHPRKHILTLFQHLSETKITLEQVLTEGDIDLVSLRTFNAIQVTYQKNGNVISKQQIILPYKQAKQSFKRFSFEIVAKIKLLSDKTSSSSAYFVLTFDLQDSKNLKAFIESLSIDSNQNSQKQTKLRLQTQQNNACVEMKVFAFQNSYPIDAISNYSHPFGPKSYPSSKYPYNQLPNYSAPNIRPQGKLYICHDFKGGYLEDANDFQFSNPLSYRFLNLDKCFIFNYFSHHTVSIPPLHWRKVCRKYNVKCLGTFIVQGNQIAAEQYLTQQYCQFLIFLARKVQFDGYLINIEFEIKQQQVKRLIVWLGNLTKGIHMAIPNSNIVWYDSIKQNGKIGYQNSLNVHNIPFVEQVDYFFTNYWWNEQKMKETMSQLRKNPTLKSKVFVGNDCFGRNTYGGGQYNICEAANKLEEINQNNKQEQLKIALFAPGFTYQGQGQANRQLWLLNQQRMYHGLQSKIVKIEQWSSITNRGNGWKQQAKWAVTSYQWCQRMFELSLDSYFQANNQQGQLAIKFQVSIKGTPPNAKDLYKIVLQLYEKQHHFIMNQTKPLDFNNPDFASENQMTIIEQICIPLEMITKGLCFRIYQMGKDVQYWGGHFGTQFSGQLIYLSVRNSSRNWINKVRTSSINEIPYHSFCNMGNGDSFFLDGQRVAQSYVGQKGYGFLSDMDIPMTRLLNDYHKIDISYKDSYIGGTCLRIKDQKWQLVKIEIPKEQRQLQQAQSKINIKIRLVIKGLKNKLVLVKTKKQSSHFQTRDLRFEWKQYVAILAIQTGIQETIQVDATDAFLDYCMLGQLQITPVQQKQVRVTQTDIVQSIISLSPQYVQVSPNYFIDAAVQFTQIAATNIQIRNLSQYMLVINQKTTNKVISCCFITSLVDNTFIFRNVQVRPQSKEITFCIEKRSSGEREVVYKRQLLLNQLLFKKIIQIK